MPLLPDAEENPEEGGGRPPLTGVRPPTGTAGGLSPDELRGELANRGLPLTTETQALEAAARRRRRLPF